jgi:hypothetical protein
MQIEKVTFFLAIGLKRSELLSGTDFTGLWQKEKKQQHKLDGCQIA